MIKMDKDLESTIEGSIDKNRFIKTLSGGERVVEVTRPYGKLLTLAYHVFMEEIFAKNEVDPLSSMRQEVSDKENLDALAQEGEKVNPIVYVTLVKERKVIGACYGNVYEQIEKDGSISFFGAIGLNGVIPQERRRGYAKEMYDAVEDLMAKYALSKGGKLKSIVLESNMPQEIHEGMSEKSAKELKKITDAVPFWRSVGFRATEGTCKGRADYSQPSMAFTPSGDPKEPKIPLQFMIKMLDGSPSADPEYLTRVTNTMVDDWYMPEEERFSEGAYQKITQYLGEIKEDFKRSLIVREGRVILK